MGWWVYTFDSLCTLTSKMNKFDKFEKKTILDISIRHGVPPPTLKYKCALPCVRLLWNMTLGVFELTICSNLQWFPKWSWFLCSWRAVTKLWGCSISTNHRPGLKFRRRATVAAPAPLTSRESFPLVGLGDDFFFFFFFLWRKWMSAVYGLAKTSVVPFKFFYSVGSKVASLKQGLGRASIANDAATRLCPRAAAWPGPGEVSVAR